MKNKELVEKALANLKMLNGKNKEQCKEPIKLLEQFLISNAVQNLKFNVSDCCSKEGLRPVFSGVFYQNGKATATDGHVLSSINCEYDKKLEGKIITAKGIEIKDVRFPEYEHFLPKIKELKTFRFDIPKLNEKLKEGRIIGKDVYGFVFKISAYENTTFFKYDDFKIFVSFINAYKDSDVGLSVSGSNTYIYAEDKDRNLIMLYPHDESKDFLDIQDCVIINN